MIVTKDCSDLKTLNYFNNLMKHNFYKIHIYFDSEEYDWFYLEELLHNKNYWTSYSGRKGKVLEKWSKD